MDHILYQIFRIILSILSKYKKIADNPLLHIYFIKTENRITFKIKIGCYLKLLTPTVMKLLGSTESKISLDKKVKNKPHLEITKVIY